MKSLFAAALCLAAPGEGFAASGAYSLETAVKAAFLSKYGSYVTWPPAATPPASGTFNLCVVGNDPFGGVLDEAAAGQTAQGRPIAIRRYPTLPADFDCQILYAAGSDTQSPEQIIRSVGDRPILTITSLAHGDRPKGMINFVIQDNRVRFEIDASEAARVHLSISSKLLGLATFVSE